MLKILITGGLGFIGSALVRYLLSSTNSVVINIDKLTYAANPLALEDFADNSNYFFHKIDVCEKEKIAAVINKYSPDTIIHLAAESHVDRSIAQPEIFIETNIVGTHNILNCAYKYWSQLNDEAKSQFRFIYASTDEVYGARKTNENIQEGTAFNPSSPYASSKAAATHLVSSYYKTYGFPVLITYSSNNYGPWQNAEKLIPKVIEHALCNRPIPVYGKGDCKRDWLYVDDYVKAVLKILHSGAVGNVYNISSGVEISNLDLINNICQQLNTIKPLSNNKNYLDLIRLVTDRLGHDQRYGIDSNRIRQELGWSPTVELEQGLAQTIKWYVDFFD